MPPGELYDGALKVSRLLVTGDAFSQAISGFPISLEPFGA